eukprot:12284728-Alexandrium_andersonii.AAC.1
MALARLSSKLAGMPMNMSIPWEFRLRCSECLWSCPTPPIGLDGVTADVGEAGDLGDVDVRAARIPRRRRR